MGTRDVANLPWHDVCNHGGVAAGPAPRARILLVDDEPAARQSLKAVLESHGYDVAVAHDVFEALAAMPEVQPSLVISDLAMPAMYGVELLQRIWQQHPGVGIVVTTAHGEVDAAVEVMRAGALDYLVKPLNVDRLLQSIAKAMAGSSVAGPRALSGAAASSCCDGLIGASPEMQQVRRSIAQVAPSRASVLLTGESGTGKEAVARALHLGSPRAQRAFVALDCAALSESSLESELFGQERGSFADADEGRPGRIEQAHGGTLFLDEVGAMGSAIQVKLLRALQERVVERVGGNATIRVDVRVVAGSKRNLRELVAAGKFREDLLYRLNVVSLHLPPLRQRRADIPALARHFLSKHAAANGSKVTGFSDEALELLVQHDWPGNVRQLENAVEHATVFAAGDLVEAANLPAELRVAPRAQVPPAVPGTNLDELERYAILKTMEAVGGSTRKAAELLGISVRKVQYRLRQYGVAPAGAAPDTSRDLGAKT